jgi:hypothetical protein
MRLERRSEVVGEAHEIVSWHHAGVVPSQPVHLAIDELFIERLCGMIQVHEVVQKKRSAMSAGEWT